MTNSPQTIDWQTGKWQNSRSSKGIAEIAICADWAPIRGFKDIIRHTPSSVYGDLLPELRDADLRVVNLECPLTDKTDAIVKSGAVLKGSPDHVAGLTAVPFEIASMGNNHVFDYGIEAFEETRKLLLKNNIKTLGAGENREAASNPLVVEIHKLKVGLISFSEGEDLTSADEHPGVYGWEVDRVVEQVISLKEYCHAVVVICHAGLEYIPYPPPYVIKSFRRIAKAGADLIIGHHPHVPQGIHIYDQVPICFSLGNFVFFQHTNLFWRKIGYFIKAGISESGLSHIRIIPYEILTHKLQLLTNHKFRHVMRKLENISTPLNNLDQSIAAWHGFIRYYGLTGFKDEIESIMLRFSKDPAKGAAMFRNRITTMQHNQHLADTMTRIVNGVVDEAPGWAYETVLEWFTRKISDGYSEAH